MEKHRTMKTEVGCIIGAEDPEFINGSYAFAQKYVHDLDAWRGLPTEVQEKYVGRRKRTALLHPVEGAPRAYRRGGIVLGNR